MSKQLKFLNNIYKNKTSYKKKRVRRPHYETEVV